MWFAGQDDPVADLPLIHLILAFPPWLLALRSNRWGRFMRWMAVVLLASACGGCGLAAQAVQQKASEEALAQGQAAVAACAQQYPMPRHKQHAAWSACVNQAERMSYPNDPFPDLIAQRHAARLLYAGKIDRGEMSLEEANAVLAKINSEMAGEWERRMLARRSTGAQEVAANAAYRSSLGTTCTRFGNSVSCY